MEMGRVCLYGRAGTVGQRREACERERGKAAEGPGECLREVADAQTVLNRVCQYGKAGNGNATGRGTGE